MCGRYRLRSSELARSAGIGLLPNFEEFSQIRIVPRFDYRPTNQVLIIRLNGAGQRIVDSARWGFAPAWASGAAAEPSINARGETVAKLSKFRQAFNESRCLLPADGFYEPKGPKTGKRRQQFYFERPDQGVFAMAGIYTMAQDGLTVALITISPNAMMAAIHERMPVILSPVDCDKWLDPKTSIQELQRLIRPAPEDLLQLSPDTPPVEDEPGLFG